MNQYQLKISHFVRDEKSGSDKKDNIILLCPAVNYTDAEIVGNKIIEEYDLRVANIESISKIKTHLILNKPDQIMKSEDHYWWKGSTKYVSENEKGKTEIFYVYYVIHAKTLQEALNYVVNHEKDASSVQGLIEQIVRTDLTHVLITSDF